ncbi:hypothetical protein GPJ56_001120 [Histomonas meleagridis]|uniref:uncharacterized protein n=1 Tax=Histomonas meleagridis TaxID=135588 RepID=UPI003559D17D|nr:hypothetical protein GPJ56_001120 [Histomonas meleagridis]KAH0798480.1 hypothetical protein GO595_008750 [Histomonas meleagridis]
MKVPWLLNELADVNIDEVEIVLISDPRSLYLADLLLTLPDFNGIILCTEAVYRIGRAFLTDFQILLDDKRDPLPTNHSYIPLHFDQHYQFGNISFIPVPNGTGIGNSNWILTKGVDPELVSFGAYIMTGLWPTPYFFPAPRVITDIRIDAICVLPSSYPTNGVQESLELISSEVSKFLSERKKVIIPSFFDDSLYLLMLYLRYERSITYEFVVFSFIYERLVDAIKAFQSPNSTDHDINVSIYQNVDARVSSESKIIFAPYPTREFGQIIELQKIKNPSFYFLDRFSLDNFSSNCNREQMTMFLTQMKANPYNPKIYSTQEFMLTERIEYPAYQDLGNFIHYWMDGNVLSNYTKDVAGIKMISGKFEGERIIPSSYKPDVILNVPDEDEIGLRLMEQGATQLRKEGNAIFCKFEFVDGDNEVKIVLENGDVFVETGSILIENAVLSVLGAYY